MSAASKGNLDSIRWFLSDVPEQKYKEFAANFADIDDVKSIASIPGGFEGVLSSWLTSLRKYSGREPRLIRKWITKLLLGHLALHCAVLCPPTKETGNAHVELTLKAIPESLNAKDPETGATPLHLAFSKRRLMAAKELIKAGADQTARDHKGRNMLHQILCQPTQGIAMKSVGLFKELAKLLDKEVLNSLATQRSHVNPGTFRGQSWGMQTPLAEWLEMNKVDDSETDLLRAILEVTGPQALYILDGTGNYPVHQLVRKKRIAFVQVMLEMDPNLALLENATGITPLELAENKVVSSTLETLRKGSASLVTRQTPEDYNGTPTMYQALSDQYRYMFGTTHKPSYKDVYRGKTKDEHRTSKDEQKDRELYYLLREAADKHGVKRGLVSLQDANQLVKRLAGRKFPKPEEEGERRTVPVDNVVSKYSNNAWEDTWEVQEILDREKECKEKAALNNQGSAEEESDESDY